QKIICVVDHSVVSFPFNVVLSLFNRRPDLPVCSHADVSGISQVSRQSIPCLCPALATPAEPTIPRLLDGFVDAVPALPTAKTSAVMNFGALSRGFGTRCLRFKNRV